MWSFRIMEIHTFVDILRHGLEQKLVANVYDITKFHQKTQITIEVTMFYFCITRRHHKIAVRQSGPPSQPLITLSCLSLVKTSRTRKTPSAPQRRKWNTRAAVSRTIWGPVTAVTTNYKQFLLTREGVLPLDITSPGSDTRPVRNRIIITSIIHASK